MFRLSLEGALPQAMERLPVRGGLSPVSLCAPATADWRPSPV
ncbi:MAG: hypothetical protein OXC07_06720 [Kistimonas sp.]|nr:hypothetical protein [Kistimonas sp.]